MTDLPESIRCPQFTAIDYDGEVIASDDALAVVLAELDEIHDPDAAEELAIWKDGEIVVAVLKADGRIVHLEPFDEPVPAAKPVNGRSRRRK